MKKTLLQSALLILAIFLAKTTMAQITITADDYVRNGDFTVSSSNATNLDIPLPSEGENQFWDYSDLIAGTTSETNYFDPSGNPYFNTATSSKAARIIFEAFAIDNTLYEEVNEDGWFNLGYHIPDVSFDISAISGGPNDVIEFGGTQAFVGVNKLIEFPMQYQNQFNSEYTFELDFKLTAAGFGLDQVPGQRIQTSNSNSQVVGYGQLVIPDENGNAIEPVDVLLLKVESTLVTNYFLGGAPAPQVLLDAFNLTQGYTYTYTQYGFYTPGLNATVLYFSIDSTSMTVSFTNQLKSDDKIELSLENFDRHGDYNDTLITANETSTILPALGENQHWDYSDLTVQSQRVTEHFESIDNSDFPDATGFHNNHITFQSFVISSDLYERVDDNGWTVLGRDYQEASYSITPISGGPNDIIRFEGGSIPYQDGNEIIKFPAGFNQEWSTDNINILNYSLTVQGFGLDNVPGNRIKTSTGTRKVVGTGQLILPDMDGNPLPPIDAIIIHEQSTVVDSFNLGGAPAPDQLLAAFGLSQNLTTTINNYAFYAPGYNSAVLYLPNNNQTNISFRVRQHKNEGNNILYVDQSANGMNDGTSWTNAYTELHDAIQYYKNGDEIWVAQGTYSPDEMAGLPSGKRSFFINKDVAIYGGFAGGESMRDERDPTNNSTILSGDVLGDDITDDFDNNKSDNVDNIFFVQGQVTDATIIDGFTIRGGHASGDPNIFTDNRGSAIFTFAPIQMSNCRFTQNFSTRHGGAVYYFEIQGSGSLIYKCTFDYNMSQGSGGGATAADIRETITIDSCVFNNNTSMEYGGGLYTTFSKVILTNCDFNENFSLERGGGLYSAITVGYDGYYTHTDNCIFNGNSSSIGGALFYNASSSFCDFKLTNSTFNENFVEDYLGNSLSYGGGAITLASVGEAVNNTYSVDNCVVKNNTSSDFGGGILISNYTTEGENFFNIDNCLIEDNHADNNAGGIGVVNEDNLAEVRITNTLFNRNKSPVGSGFIVSSLSNNLFLDSDIKLINCNFINHSDTEGFVVGFQDHNVDLINCTITDNESPGVGLFNNASALITNNIINSDIFPTFVNVGENEEPIRSNGGNMISDNGLGDAARTSDQSETIPVFMGGTYQLAEESLGVDQGVIHNETTAFDIEGNDRVRGGCIDIGAYESPFDKGSACVTATKENHLENNFISLFPNPAISTITIEMENQWKSDVNIKIINSLGQIIFSEVYRIHSSSISIPIEAFDSSHYSVILTDGISMGTASFIKI